MTKKQIANSKRRTLKRAKKSIRRRTPVQEDFGLTPKQIQKLPGQGMTDAKKRALGRKFDVEFARQENIIVEAFKRVPAKDREVVLPGYTIREEESEGIIIYGDERDDKFLKANKNNPYLAEWAMRSRATKSASKPADRNLAVERLERQ